MNTIANEIVCEIADHLLPPDVSSLSQSSSSLFTALSGYALTQAAKKHALMTTSLPDAILDQNMEALEARIEFAPPYEIEAGMRAAIETKNQTAIKRLLSEFSGIEHAKWLTLATEKIAKSPTYVQYNIQYSPSEKKYMGAAPIIANFAPEVRKFYEFLGPEYLIAYDSVPRTPNRFDTWKAMIETMMETILETAMASFPDYLLGLAQVLREIPYLDFEIDFSFFGFICETQSYEFMSTFLEFFPNIGVGIISIMNYEETSGYFPVLKMAIQSLLPYLDTKTSKVIRTHINNSLEFYFTEADEMVVDHDRMPVYYKELLTQIE